MSSLVREFLTELAADESDFDQRARLQNEVLAGIKNFRAGSLLSRVRVHDRRAVR